MPAQRIDIDQAKAHVQQLKSIVVELGAQKEQFTEAEQETAAKLAEAAEGKPTIANAFGLVLHLVTAHHRQQQASIAAVDRRIGQELANIQSIEAAIAEAESPIAKPELAPTNASGQHQQPPGAPGGFRIVLPSQRSGGKH